MRKGRRSKKKSAVLTARICQALQDVKLIREGKLKAMTMEEFLDEL
jgi:hypothetical protein